MDFVLTSSAFAAGEAIPRRHTRNGLDLSPPLVWTAPPQGTSALALLVEDPDAPAGAFAHWLIYDLPATECRLGEGIPRAHHLPRGAKQGRNDYGHIGYGGPAPPPGRVHRYCFQLFALREAVRLAAGMTSPALRQLLDRRTLGYAELVGTYGL